MDSHLFTASYNMHNLFTLNIKQDNNSIKIIGEVKSNSNTSIKKIIFYSPIIENYFDLINNESN